MHVKMEDRLIGHLAIGEKHVHSLTRQLGAPQCPRQQMDDLKQVRRQSLVDVLQARGVRLTVGGLQLAAVVKALVSAVSYAPLLNIQFELRGDADGR